MGLTKSGIERSAMVAPRHDPVTALEVVRHDIDVACRDAGRPSQSVALLAVSKTYGPEAIEPVIAAGQRVFGENRVQEANAKWPELRERHQDLELHLIGALQSNKVREAIALFDAIHSVDRPSLCAALAKEIQKQGRAPLMFAQVNSGAEPQKAGGLAGQADTFIAACCQSYCPDFRCPMCI